MTRPTLLNYVTCAFGVKGSWMAGYHTGIDYRAPVGTPVFATKRGRVVHAGYGGAGSAYGNHIMIQHRHEGRTIQSLYAHLSREDVTPGARVVTGQKIGLSGQTGNTFGPHLHYEERVSPFNYWAHIRPVLINYRPKSEKWLDIVLKRIGVRK